MIIIEDEYELIENNFLEETSKIFKTEVARITNSSSADISMIRFYDNGELIRLKSYGLEDCQDMLSGDELKSVEGVGPPTIYEEKGSDTNYILSAFMKGRVESSEVNIITIFKEK